MEVITSLLSTILTLACCVSIPILALFSLTNWARLRRVEEHLENQAFKLDYIYVKRDGK